MIEPVSYTHLDVYKRQTHDDRRVVPWTCFSVEPGIYLPEFGVRSEIDMFIGENDARVTGEIQREMALL